MNRKLEFLIVALFILTMRLLAQVADQPTSDAKPDGQPAAAATASAATSSAADAPGEIPESHAAELDAKFGQYQIRDWVMPFPRVSDSILQDAGGFRTELAKHRLGFFMFSLNEFDYNLKAAPMAGMIPDPDGVRRQVYLGQRATEGGPTVFVVTYSPSPTTQFVLEGIEAQSNWAPMVAGDGLHQNGVYLDKRFMNGRLDITGGYMYNDSTFYEGYIAGSIGAGTLGQNAIIQYMIGQSHGNLPRPGVNVKFDITKHFYTITGFEDSLNPNGWATEFHHDSVGFRWNSPGAKALYIEELAYKRESAPGVKKTFARADGWLNTSHFTDFREGSGALLGIPGFAQKKSDNNFAISLAVDQQLTQPDRALPFRGWYSGFTFQYAPPQQNPFTQYYEFRAYDIGPLRSRPTDMITLVANNLEYSKIAMRTFSGTAAFGVSIAGDEIGYPYSSCQSNYVVSYAVHIRPGVYLNQGFQYVVHPTFIPIQKNPFLYKAALNLFF